MSIRNYRNSIGPTVLTAGVDDVVTSLEVADSSGFPPVPFVLTLEQGEVDEEVVLCTAVPDGTHFTVTRGYDGTTPSAHLIGTLVEHTSAALDYREAGLVRLTDAEATAIQGDSVDDWLGRTFFNEDQRNVFMSNGADLFVPIFPVGGMIPYGSMTPPEGWLLCDGSEVAQASYPELFAVIGHNFGADPMNGNFVLPPFPGRMPIGVTGAGTASAIGETGGAIDHTHLQTAHTHSGPSHTHTNPTTAGTDPGDTSSAGTHTHTQNNSGLSLSNHSHSNPSTSSDNHAHNFSDNFTTGTGSTFSGVDFGNNTNRPATTHSHSGSVSGTTSSDNHSHTQGSTGVADLSHLHTPGTIISNGAHTHTMGTHTHTQGVTGASGTDETGNGSGTGATDPTSAANQAYLAVPWIIFAGVTGG